MGLDFKNPLIQWVTLVLLALTWGSSFILMKKGLEYFGADEVAAYRISIAMVVLLPVALKNLREFKGRFWPLLAAGMFGNAIPAFLFAIAQTEIPSALSGILNSLTSLFTLLIGIALFKTAIVKRQVIGVVVALVGALGLIGFQSLLQFGTYGKFASLIVVASACYGVGVNVIKRYLHHVKPTHITSLSFLLIGPLILVYLLGFTDFTTKVLMKPEARVGVLYLSILGIVGTAIAVIIFNRLIKETTAVFASSVTYLIPVVALGWGLIDGERIAANDMIFMLVILTGIFLINSAAPGKLYNRMFR